MLTSHLYLIVLYITAELNGIQASDDREHVHIKVHMPEVIRKHNHFHKVKKYQHHQPRPHKHHQSHQQHQHQPIDLELLYTPENIGPQFFPTALAALPEPEFVDGDDADDDGGGGGGGINNYAPDVLSAMMEGDSVTFPQPYRPAMPPPLAPHASTAASITTSTTHLPLLRQQLMQQLFSPEIMSVLAGGGAVGDASGGGVGGGDTNTLLADDFLTELKKEYTKKLQQQKLHGEKLSPGKLHKKKKYAGDSSYRKQRPHHHRHHDQEQYGNHFQSSSIFDMRPKFHNHPPRQQQHHHHQQQQQQQQLQQEFNEDLSDMMAEFDDKAAGEETNGSHSDEDGESMGAGDGESYQDMFAAFTQSADVPLPMPATTTATRLQWRPYRQQHDSHFMLPSMHLTTTPFSSFPLTSSTAATSTQSASTNLNESFYKKRKNRLKSKRTRISGSGQ